MLLFLLPTKLKIFLFYFSVLSKIPFSRLLLANKEEDVRIKEDEDHARAAHAWGQRWKRGEVILSDLNGLSDVNRVFHAMEKNCWSYLVKAISGVLVLSNQHRDINCFAHRTAMVWVKSFSRSCSSLDSYLYETDQRLRLTRKLAEIWEGCT